MPAVALTRGLTRIRDECGSAHGVLPLSSCTTLSCIRLHIDASTLSDQSSQQSSAEAQLSNDAQKGPPGLCLRHWFRVALINHTVPPLRPRNFKVCGRMEKCPSGYGAAFRNTLLLPNSSASAREFESRLLQPLVSSSPSFLAWSGVVRPSSHIKADEL